MKSTGLGERFFLNAYDLSGDIGAIGSLTDSRNQQDVTSLKDLAHARLGLLKDAALSYTAFFDVAAGGEHPVLRGLPQSALVTWATGTAAGSPAGSLIANATDYALSRGADGSLVITPSAAGSGYGMEWGNLLTTGLQTFASSGVGTYIDDYVPIFGTLPLPSVLGLTAYLHVISVGSGTATVHIQDSSDHISFADVTGAVFTGATGPTSQRIATSATQAVKRYLQISAAGTFTNLVAAVAVVRHIAA